MSPYSYTACTQTHSGNGQSYCWNCGAVNYWDQPQIFSTTANIYSNYRPTQAWSNFEISLRGFTQKLSKAVRGSVKQLARMAAFGIEPLWFKPRVCKLPLPKQVYRRAPRNRVMRWPSLNEKRIAWGTK